MARDRSENPPLRATPRLALLAVGLALVLGACENVKDQLGLNKSSPDEFSVLTRAPLSLPPDYKLRPPEPGVERPQETSVEDQVKAALFDAAPASGDGAQASAGESALLARAGSPDAGSDIRAVINRDNAIYAEEGDGFVDSMIFWREPEDRSVIVDPSREDQRIQEAEAVGDAPSEGETAIIKRSESGILEGLF